MCIYPKHTRKVKEIRISNEKVKLFFLLVKDKGLIFVTPPQYDEIRGSNKWRVIDRINKNWNTQWIYSILILSRYMNGISTIKILISEEKKISKLWMMMTTTITIILIIFKPQTYTNMRKIFSKIINVLWNLGHINALKYITLLKPKDSFTTRSCGIPS